MWPRDHLEAPSSGAHWQQRNHALAANATRERQQEVYWKNEIFALTRVFRNDFRKSWVLKQIVSILESFPSWACEMDSDPNAILQQGKSVRVPNGKLSNHSKNNQCMAYSNKAPNNNMNWYLYTYILYQSLRHKVLSKSTTQQINKRFVNVCAKMVANGQSKTHSEVLSFGDRLPGCFDPPRSPQNHSIHRYNQFL